MQRIGYISNKPTGNSDDIGPIQEYDRRVDQGLLRDDEHQRGLVDIPVLTPRDITVLKDEFSRYNPELTARTRRAQALPPRTSSPANPRIPQAVQVAIWVLVWRQWKECSDTGDPERPAAGSLPVR